MKDSTKKAAPNKRLLSMSLVNRMPVKSQDRLVETRSRFESDLAARVFQVQARGKVLHRSEVKFPPKFA